MLQDSGRCHVRYTLENYSNMEPENDGLEDDFPFQ